MVHSISRNSALQQESIIGARARKFIAGAAAATLVALAIFAIVAVSVPSAGAPAWLMGATLFFESFAAPSLLGFVIPVKAVVYCLAGLTILLAGNVGLVMATSRQKDEYDPSPEYEEVLCEYTAKDQMADEAEDDTMFVEAQKQKAFNSDVRFVKLLLALNPPFTKEEIQNHRLYAGQTPFSEDVFAAATK
jgi:hypothetical protein